MGKEQSDEQLMLDYREDDVSAFEILYKRHKGALYRYLLRQCGNQSTAEELYQEVWMNLINARQRYAVKAKFTTYLFQMAHNRLIDHYRRQKPANPGTSETPVDGLPARQQEQPEQQALLHEQTDKIVAMVETLPPEQREAFLLKEEAGRSIQEIAEITGVNTETAKSRLRYAVHKLRQALSE
ncbi:MAG: RNA polymerase sigma factor [Gammaproteobacteria bacterium]